MLLYELPAMRKRRLARWLAVASLTLAVEACVVHDAQPVNPGYAGARLAVAEPSPYNVASLPPEPLYEQMTASPGDGFVWIDGYWHWNGLEWVWVGGRWERQQEGYLYVQPNYDYAEDHYVYTPGSWASPDRVPPGWSIVRDHRGARPVSV